MASDDRIVDSLNDDIFYPVIAQKGIVIVDFWAEWCEPCNRMLKLLSAFANRVSDVAKVYKAEEQDIKEVSKVYGIKKIPTFVFFRDGNEVTRFSGIKTLQEIENITRSL